jgi:CHAT domain-containing protein
MKELSQYLIKPIKDIVEQSNSIIFVPHSLLHYIPLHALEIDGNPLILTHKISYLLTLGLLQFMDKGNKQKTNKRSCNAFGVDNGKDPEFLEEAKDIISIFRYNNKVNSKYIENPSKEIVIENLDADILHFSCHGYFYNKDPLESGIVLKDEEKLTAKDFFSLPYSKRINAELVTLSACDTGISKNKPGDELIGLSRSLLYAGANSLVLSLWSVSSLAAKELMISFYKNLKNGDSKATALQKAQIDLREKWSKEYGKEVGGHPYFWAPFILIGDWR